MLRLGFRRAFLASAAAPPVSAPAFALDEWAADIKFAGSTARFLFRTEVAVTAAQVFAATGGASDAIQVDQSGVTADWTSIVNGSNIGMGTLFNQISGTGKWSSPTQATAASRLLVQAAAGTRYTIGGKTAMNSTGGTTNNLGWASNQTTGNSWGAVMVVQFSGTSSEAGITGGDAVTQYFGQMSSSRLSFVCAAPIGTLTNYVGTGIGAAYTPVHPLGGRPMVLTFRVKNGEQVWYINGKKEASSTVATNFPAAVRYIGGNVLGTNSWRGPIAEFVVFNDADSAGIAALTDNACEFYGAKRPVICIGDSLTQGFNAGTVGGISQSTPQQLLDTSSYIVFSYCTPGWKIEDLQTNLDATRRAAYFGRLSGSTKKTICICEIGANNMNTTDTALDAYNKLKSLWTDIRNAGADLWAVTPSGMVDTANVSQAKLTGYANYILSDTSLYTGVIRLDNDPNIGIGQHGNTTYFSAVDGTHLTTAGYGVKAALQVAALNAHYTS